MRSNRFILVFSVAIAFASNVPAATTILYNQDFENPAAFVNAGGDVNIFNSVNTLYGNQPPGFTFAQAFTVETFFVNGNQACGMGYSDPSGRVLSGLTSALCFRLRGVEAQTTI